MFCFFLMCFGDECSARKTSTDRKCQPLQMQLSKVQRMLSILLRRASENVDEESPFFFDGPHVKMQFLLDKQHTKPRYLDPNAGRSTNFCKDGV